MKAIIEVSWLDTVDGDDVSTVIQDGIELSELDDRWSQSHSMTAVEKAWKWIREMYNIPDSNTTLELTIKFKNS